MRYRIDHDEHSFHVHEWTAWAQANDLDPTQIPVPSDIDISNGQLTVELYVLDEHGRIVLTEDGTDSKRTTHTVPLRQAPTFVDLG